MSSLNVNLLVFKTPVTAVTSCITFALFINWKYVIGGDESFINLTTFSLTLYRYRSCKSGSVSK